MKTTTEQPSPKLDGLTFFPVPVFDKPTQAFGPPESAYFKRYDLPKVPDKFERMANDLMFSGGQLPEMSNQVDREKATAAVGAWLRSFAPAHEAKTATVGYALWVWTTMPNKP